MFNISKDQIETPALLLDLDVFESNIKIMSDFMNSKSASLRPHFKTFKCPPIAQRLIASGAKGITCSKLSEAETLVASGIRDVLIANQIVDPVKIYKLAGLAKGEAKITVAVDNPENIEDLSKATVLLGSTIYCLVEVDVGMGRCGVNTPGEVLSLAKKISGSKGLVFEGIQAYEGHVILNPNLEARRDGVNNMLTKVLGIKRFLEKHNISVNEISGGGSGTYFMTGNNTIWTEIQAGSYVFMDTTYSKLEGLEFKNALTILSTIIHKRPGIAVADLGLKTCTTESGQPSIKGYSHISLLKKLNEEHAIIEDEKNDLIYKQKIEFIPSHCCTTVNLHDNFYCIRNGILEAIWPITGRGKSQ
jgi:D-serine deaminase-like pyridoxal phosphate-dependent protein